MNRRHFLKTAGAVTLGFAGLRSFIACKETRGIGYGPLISDPNKIFDLPKGFSYQIISRQGQELFMKLKIKATVCSTDLFPTNRSV